MIKKGTHLETRTNAQLLRYGVSEKLGKVPLRLTSPTPITR